VATRINPQNDGLYAHPSTKKKDVATKRLRTRSVTDGISRRVTGGSHYTGLILVGNRVKPMSINRNVMLLQQDLPAVCHLKRVFHLSAGQCGARRTERLMQSTFPCNFARFFQNRLSSKFVIKQWSNVPPQLSHFATLHCDVSLVIIHVSDCC